MDLDWKTIRGAKLREREKQLHPRIKHKNAIMRLVRWAHKQTKKECDPQYLLGICDAYERLAVETHWNTNTNKMLFECVANIRRYLSEL